MKIESLDRNVQQVLSTGYYRIPRFQRPYSWTAENLEEFWTDTIVDSEADYFIGAVIVFETGSNRFDCRPRRPIPTSTSSSKGTATPIAQSVSTGGRKAGYKTRTSFSPTNFA
jgi:hypothetical protein